MPRRSVFVTLIAIAATFWFPTGVARGNGSGPPEELLFHYTPAYAEASSETVTHEGDLPGGLADADADADPSGSIDLSAMASGRSVSLIPATPPSAGASGRVAAPSFAWAGNQLRLEARFSYRLEIEQVERWRLDLAEYESETIRASVSAGWAGETPWIWSEGWGATDSTTSSGLQVGDDGHQIIAGAGTVQTYVRAPCAGTELTPLVDARVNVALPELALGAQEAGRSAALRVFVSEMFIYRDTVMPCYEIVDIAVLDNAFEPADVTVQLYNMVRFDFSGAQGYHDVIVPGHGSAYPGDPITMYQPGVHIFYCRIHGTPDGQGMAGTITVT